MYFILVRSATAGHFNVLFTVYCFDSARPDGCVCNIFIIELHPIFHSQCNRIANWLSLCVMFYNTGLLAGGWQDPKKLING